MSIEEEQGVESLVLSRCGDLPSDGQEGEEGFDLLLSHFQRMSFLVKEDESFDPKDIGLLRGSGIVLSSNRLADLIEELFRGRHFLFAWSPDLKYDIHRCNIFITLPA